MESIFPLPDWNPRGFLPPRLTPAWTSSPYLVSLEQVIERFGYTERRCHLIGGFLDMRAELRRIGFERGFQWLAGSFLDEVERIEERDPGDIDTCSFLYNPESVQDDFELAVFLADHGHITDRKQAKKKYLCDSFLIPLQAGQLAFNPESLAARMIHWIQLFGNEKQTEIVKGILQVDFETMDEDAGARMALMAKKASFYNR